jgi:processive 1,2-diacylglycerol beta-glucosyltransferase
MQRKRIWLVTARVGAGHVQAAKSIEEEFVVRGLGDQVGLIDIMTCVPAWFRKLYAGGYTWLASHAPRFYGFLFRITDTPDSIKPKAIERLRVRIEGQCIRRLKKVLIQDDPDWVIHTHFLAPHPLTRWIAQNKLHTRQAAIVTDFHPHRIWMNAGVDLYCVPSEEAYARLIACGIPRDRIAITGIPLLAKHRLPTNRAATFQEFGWPKDRRVILLMSGSDFVIGPITRIVSDILVAFPDVTLQVATGNNDSLRSELEGLKITHPNLRVIGYCDKMQELFAACDIVISKTGGITTSECLAHGAAMIALFPVPGQEEFNADYLAQFGAGLKVTEATEVVPAIKTLFDEPGLLSQVRQKARELGRPRAVEAIVDLIVGKRPSRSQSSQTEFPPLSAAHVSPPTVDFP